MTSRGNEKKAVFKDDHDRDNFLRTLQHVNKRYNWLCHAYCLMDNHYHLLIETPDGNLALGMRQLNGVYTQFFNNRRNRTGHLFQGRYKAVLIQKDTHLLEVCRYAVLNPVRAHMVELPGQWKWSSYLATAGREEPHPCLTTDWVLGQFSRTRAKATKEYRQFVSWGIGKGTIWTDVKGQILLGDDDFVAGHADHLRKRHHIPEIPKSQRFANRPPLETIFIRRVLDDTRKRDKKVIEAVDRHGYRQSEVARHLGLHASTVCNIMRKSS
ncbi:MAG: transposase [Nitrospiraceae bacterium]|nr:transposase [Nitrospiraceae bacterium]